MSNIILFIDSENFLHKIEDIISRINAPHETLSPTDINVRKLINNVLSSQNINQVKFYAAKLHYNQQTASKSKQLIATQRRLRNMLVNQGVEFILAGNVRAQSIENGKVSRIIFREKGVDVRLAVDMVSLASDKKISKAILCSSDSDLQPAVSELKRRGVEVIYLGFESKPNKGLVYTCDRTILFRDAEIIEALECKKGQTRRSVETLGLSDHDDTPIKAKKSSNVKKKGAK